MVPAGDWPQNEVYQILSDLHMSSSSDTIAKIWIVAENSSIPYQLASCCVNVIVEVHKTKNNIAKFFLYIINFHINLRLQPESRIIY